mgnify:CR=1 FL=1
MARECQYCGKRSLVGNKITRRGMAKKKGGVGKKTTGITKRLFRVNLQRVRAVVGGEVKRVRICTGCMKAGRIVKPA